MRTSNPRPPRQWWDMMFKNVSKDYPKKRSETLDHYRKAISQIVGGIWWGYKPSVREELIRKYDKEIALVANPIPCPACGYPNPVAKEGLFIKCANCKKNLISVKVRRK